MTEKVGLYRCKNGTKTQWRVRWYGQYIPGNGKQKRYSKTFNRKRDAEQFQKAKAAELNKGARRDPSKENLQEYGRWWLRNRGGSQNLRPGTITLYEQTLDRLYSYFGSQCLVPKIDRRAAQTFLAELKPLKGDKTLSVWTRHRILRNCKTLFADAVKDGATVVNPFAGLNGPKTVPSLWYRAMPDEYKELLRVTPTVQEKTLYALAYTTGLRLTEALALRWSDIDFAKESVQVVNRPGTETLPPFFIKDHEARTIPLPQHTISLLLQLQDEAPENIPYVILTEKRYSLIVQKWQQCRAAGKPWLNRYYANNMQRSFGKRLQRADIKPAGRTFSIHTLRKCCCQNWVDGGLPINVVKDLMGHASIATTQKYYMAVDESHRARAKAIHDELLGPGARKTDPKLTFSPDFACKEGNNQQRWTS